MDISLNHYDSQLTMERLSDMVAVSIRLVDSNVHLFYSNITSGDGRVR